MCDPECLYHQNCCELGGGILVSFLDGHAKYISGKPIASYW